MVGNSTWGQNLDAYDLTFVAAEDDGDDLGVMLARDKDAAIWSGEHDPALESEQFRHRPMSYIWKNGGVGAGHSQRTPDVTTTSVGGALTSLAYSYAPWTTSVVPGVLMPSGAVSEIDIPDVVTSGFIYDCASYGGDLYISVTERYLIKIEDSNGATSAVDCGVGYTPTSTVVFSSGGTSYLWIAGQNSGTIRRYDGTTLTNGGAGTYASRLAVVNWTISPQIATGGAALTGGTNAARMIATENGFKHISSNDDPLVDADWSGDIAIGDNSYGTQWIASNNHTVWFGTNGGVIACDETGYTPNITEWIKQDYHPSNGGQVLFMNGVLWYAHQSGLIAVPVTGERQDLAARWAQFGYNVPNQSPIYGRPRALAPGGDCLWVGYYNLEQDTSYIMRMIFQKDGSIQWSGPEAVFSGETVTMLRKVSPASGSPYLLIATLVSGSAPKLYRQELPTSGNPYVDWINNTGHTFATSSQIYLPREDFDSASRKVSERYAIVCKNLGGGRQASIYASVDDGSYVLQGTAKRSPRRTFLAAPTTTSGVQWNWRLDMVGSATTPWILESFGVGAAIVPDRQSVRTYRIVIAERESLRTNTEEVRDPQSVWKRVEALQQRDRVEMRDQFGENLTVRVLQSIPHQVYWDERRSSWVMVCSITLRVISEPARYRTGYCYNANAYYGSAS